MKYTLRFGRVRTTIEYREVTKEFDSKAAANRYSIELLEDNEELERVCGPSVDSDVEYPYGYDLWEVLEELCAFEETVTSLTRIF